MVEQVADGLAQAPDVVVRKNGPALLGLLGLSGFESGARHRTLISRLLIHNVLALALV